MPKKYGLFVLVVGCLLLVVGLLGCGTTQESAAYYSDPSWTLGGNIILHKVLQTISKNSIGSQTGSSITESIATITPAGTGETFWFDVTGAPPYSMSCAPVGYFVAYLDGLRSGLFSKIVIRNISTEAQSGLNSVTLFFSPGIKSFDWSNDAIKMVYCTTREVHTVKLDGTADTLVTAESNISFVSWKYGSRIAFVHASGSNTLLSLIKADGTGRVDLSAAASVDLPQISSADTSVIYGLAGGRYCSVNTGAAAPATTEVLANFNGALPRLDPTAAKAVYSKTGEQSGIYILDLTAKTETKIK